MKAGRQNIRQAGEIPDFFECLVLVGKAQQIEVSVRHHDVFSLATDPAAHVYIAIGAASARWIHVQAYAGVLLFAGATATASHVKGYRDNVTFFEELDIAARLDHFAGNFMAQDQAGRGGSATAYHVLVGAADIGGQYLEDDAVVGLLTRRSDQLGKRDGLHFDFTWPDIGYASISRHYFSCWGL